MEVVLTFRSHEKVFCKAGLSLFLIWVGGGVGEGSEAGGAGEGAVCALWKCSLRPWGLGLANQ